MSTRPAGLAVVVLACTLLLAGCGEEEVPYDDGSYSSLTAADLARLDDAGVVVTSLDLPTQAAPEAVLEQLTATADLTGRLLPAGESLPAGVGELLALDAEGVDGLQATITNLADTEATSTDGRLVVLVLDDAAAAIELAASDDPVFAGGRVDGDSSTYVAGNVLGHYSSFGATNDRTEDFAAYMTSLTGL